MAEHLVSDVLARSAFVRTFAQHELISTNPNGVVVNCHPMILSTHDLWSFLNLVRLRSDQKFTHVARGARGLSGIVGSSESANTHICNSEVAF